MSKFLEKVGAINDEDTGAVEPQEKWYVEAKDLKLMIDGAIRELEDAEEGNLT